MLYSYLMANREISWSIVALICDQDYYSSYNIVTYTKYWAQAKIEARTGLDKNPKKITITELFHCYSIAVSEGANNIHSNIHIRTEQYLSCLQPRLGWAHKICKFWRVRRKQKALLHLETAERAPYVWIRLRWMKIFILMWSLQSKLVSINGSRSTSEHDPFLVALKIYLEKSWSVKILLSGKTSQIMLFQWYIIHVKPLFW
jgi:hypothetical protein